MQTLAPVPFLLGMIRIIVFGLTTLSVTGKITWLMGGQVLGRLNRIKDCLARTVARVEAGRYAPRRRSGRPRAPAVRRPRQPGPLPQKFGWLAALLPATAPGLRGDLSAWLDQPDMMELIGAAPSTLIPPLRSLCWALHLKPPPILARPRRPAPPAEPPTAAAAEALPPPPAAAPAPLPRPSPSRCTAATPPSQACGPPHPA
jgi:hypothetical protein